MRNILAAALLVASGTIAPPSRAAGFDVQLLRPTPDLTQPYFVMGTAHPVAAGSYSGGLFLDFAKNPLVLYGTDGSRLAALVDRQLTAHVTGAFALSDRLSIGAAMPVVLDQAGDSPSFVPAESSGGFGVGDLRLVPRFVLLAGASTADNQRGLSVAVEADVFIPTGSREDFQGEGFRLEPKATAEFVMPGLLRVGASLGYAVRPESQLLDVTINDMVTWSLGASHPLNDQLSVSSELHGGASVLAEDLGSEEIPLELLLGAKHRALPFLTLLGGAGFGLISGAGAPDWRVFVGVALTGQRAKDRDGDGLLDSDDSCPDDPEDADAFEDEDGCPDPDNDGDGILDADDSCINDAEDKDEFEDEDGCPDPDNDSDGILDADDSCINDAEDKDEFEDKDGCPDPDNDGDGILDDDDSCINDAEDKDEFEDENGCPDPDNDGDGVLDVSDACPLEPETINGIKDEDGCPDKGETKVKMTATKIEIIEKVYFDSGRATIKERSFNLLKQVASVLKLNPQVKKIRVEGHTDSRGNDDYNLGLSKARAQAVSTFLVGEGVGEERLEAEGFGETRPIASNDSASGRELNRRVEFVILDSGAAQGETPENNAEAADTVIVTEQSEADSAP